MVSMRLCLKCLERALRVTMFLREATVYSSVRDFRMAGDVTESAKVELGKMMIDGCIDRETYGRMMRDIQVYLPMGVESEEEIKRLQDVFWDKVYHYTMILLLGKIVDLCEVGE